MAARLHIYLLERLWFVHGLPFSDSLRNKMCSQMAVFQDVTRVTAFKSSEHKKVQTIASSPPLGCKWELECPSQFLKEVVSRTQLKIVCHSGFSSLPESFKHTSTCSYVSIHAQICALYTTKMMSHSLLFRSVHWCVILQAMCGKQPSHLLLFVAPFSGYIIIRLVTSWPIKLHLENRLNQRFLNNT